MPRKVLFATPTLLHHVCTEYHRSSIETNALLASNDIQPGWLHIGGDPYLAKVRNKLVHEFLTLSDEWGDFFFLDDDIGWPAQKVLDFIIRGEDVVAGVYPKKQEEQEFPWMADTTPEGNAIVNATGLVKARMVPTGFLRIKRRVLVEQAKTAEKYFDHPKKVKEEFADIFKTGRHPSDGWWRGEDTYWCKDYIASGGEIWVDPDIEFTHRGSKVWKANMFDALFQPQMQQPQEKAA